jgi:hypothetical protein
MQAASPTHDRPATGQEYFPDFFALSHRGAGLGQKFYADL